MRKIALETWTLKTRNSRSAADRSGGVNLSALAACILKAEEISPRIGPTNDRYWHTREACVKIAGQTSGGVVTLIAMIHDNSFKARKDLGELAKFHWAEVAHPDILLAEVHET